MNELSVFKNSRLIRSILTEACQQHPNLYTVENQVNTAISSFLLLIDRLHTSSYNLKLPQTKEAAQRVKLIVVFSNPGTYYLALKDDPYKNEPWAAWLDRKCDRAAGSLLWQLTHIATGEVPGNRILMKEAIKNHGPHIWYSGLPVENDAARKAAKLFSSLIPPENVHIIDDFRIANTVTQVQHLQVPAGINLQPDDEVVFISNDAHLARIWHTYEALPTKPFPAGVGTRLWPISTPEIGLARNTSMQAVAFLKYAFVDSPPLASPTVNPNQIHIGW